jgi:hypothetical protein
MTKEDKLKKIIEKAEKNGYKGHLKMLPVFPPKGRERKVADVIFDMNRNTIIFSHDFLKAYFGEEYVNQYRASTQWEHHAIELVLSKDRIDYLYKHLES